MITLKKKLPDCKHREIVAQTKLFTIESLDLRFQNGEQRVYERIQVRRQGAVLMVPVTQNNSILLVREYAAGLEDYDLGFPKGIIETGESKEEAANRELQEELGLAAREFYPLKSVTMAPGYFGASLDILLVQGLYPSKLEGDEPEPLEIVEWPLDNVKNLLARDDFTEARSIAALYLGLDWLNKNKTK